LTEENKGTAENHFSEIPIAAENVELLKHNLAEEKEKADKYLSNWQRAEADFSNFKKRIEQEKNETITYANRDILRNLLPTLDDLERAFISLPPKLADTTWVDGIKLIHRKLQTTIESLGVTEIDALGKPFDPNLHEAIAHMEGEEGIIIEVIRKGYKLKDKLLRPSMVAVGNGKTNEHQHKKNEQKAREINET
jgi:molecular chaperone GrpE